MPGRSRATNSIPPLEGKGGALFLGQVELEAMLLGGGDVQRLALLGIQLQRVGDQIDPFRRGLLVAGDELIDVSRRAPGLGGKIGLGHAGLGERHAHRGPEWTGVS